MHVDEVELRVVRLPYRSVFKTRSPPNRRSIAVIATVRSDGVEGYGEGVMDVAAGVPRGVDRRRAAPASRSPRSGAAARRLRRSDDVVRLVGRVARQPDGQVDAGARRVGLPCPPAGRAAAQLLGGERTEIPVGASLGMNPVPETVASVARHVEQGYKRIKLKIEPGWDIELLSAVRAEFPDDRADRRRQLGVHARRSRRAAQDRPVRPALHRAAVALGRPH